MVSAMTEKSCPDVPIGLFMGDGPGSGDSTVRAADALARESSLTTRDQDVLAWAEDCLPQSRWTLLASACGHQAQAAALHLGERCPAQEASTCRWPSARPAPLHIHR